MEEKLWHKSYPSHVPRDFQAEAVTVGELLSRTVRKFPDKTALIFLGAEISFKLLEEQVNQFTNALKNLGMVPGDKLAILMPNSPQQIIGFHSAWRAQGVAVPCNPLYTDTELEQIFNDSGATFLLTWDAFAPRMLKLRAKTKLKTIISAHLNDYMPSPTKEEFATIPGLYVSYIKEDGYYEFITLLQNASSEFDGRYAPMDSMAMLPFTGGTTGVPKGVVLTQQNISASAQFGMIWFDHLDENEIVLSGFPFFHVAGFCVGLNIGTGKGWTNLLIPRPDPAQMLQLMAQYKPTIIGALPVTFYKLLEIPEFKNSDFSSIKIFLSGATSVPVALMDALEKVSGKTLREAGGMTETSGICYFAPVIGPYKKGSCGLPAPTTETKIMDLETGTRELPVGEIGELVFRGPHIMKEYYNKPEETAVTMRNGWLCSGDIGKMDEDGYLYIIDRKKDVIVAGGYNIYPRDIEEVLTKHPKVQMACVIGVPDSYRGETVKVFIVPMPNAELSEEELNRYCRQYLAAYKVPKIYEFVDSLPTNAAGKILRKELRKK